MNSSLEDTLPASERFIDAALSEHARLGRDDCDDELVHRILCATVNRNPMTRREPVKSARQSAREWHRWMAGSGVAAALVGLILLVLSGLKMNRSERKSDQFRFLVGFAAESKSDDSPLTPPLTTREAQPYSIPLALVAPAGETAIDLSRLHGNFELISVPDTSFVLSNSDRSWVRQENLRITADLSHESADRLVYEGNVVVEHGLFRIEARRVSVPVPGMPNSGRSRELLANEVKVTQHSPRRFAAAKELGFDPISGTLSLTGVEKFQTPEGKLHQFSANDRLVLDGERFTVESPGPIMKYASPSLVVP